MRSTTLALAAALTLAGTVPAAEMPTTSPLVKLSSSELCNRCSGTLLPGRVTSHPVTRWGMISDLPESFVGHGVLYSTRDVLPDNGGAAELRAQRRSGGFGVIDGGFDVFLFHLISKDPKHSARIVVTAKNLGDKPVTLKPMQVVKSEGIIGRVHEFESTLAKRVLAGDWDVPLESVTLAPGAMRVVGFGKQFGNVDDGPDSSRNVNCFGYVRALVEGDEPVKLQVDVIAIPAGPREAMQAEAERLFDTGAKSTDEVSMKEEPQGCALGRAVGVYPNFVWTNDVPFVLDAAALDTAGTSFSMALPAIQTAGCPAARQTADLVLRPGYTREDTIGNYMIPYDVRLTLVNPSGAPVKADVVFGKTGADIGLVWQLVLKPGVQTVAGVMDDPYRGVAVNWKWAGPKQAALEASLLPEPLVLAPGETRTVCLRFMICGNSSLPFDLGVKRCE